MLAEYLPTLLFLIVATGIGIALIVVGNVLGPKRPSAEKLSPYECGFGAFENARSQFDVRYYLIAILFIVFDLEIAFVFPWALVFRELGVFGLIEMGVFLALLVIVGRVLLARFRVTDPGSTSLLGVGVVALVVLLLMTDQLFEWWSALVVPAVAAASWDSVIFDLPGRESLQRVPTIDPMRGTKAHVGELLDRSDTAEALVAALTR